MPSLPWSHAAQQLWTWARNVGLARYAKVYSIFHNTLAQQPMAAFMKLAATEHLTIRRDKVAATVCGLLLRFEEKILFFRATPMSDGVASAVSN